MDNDDVSIILLYFIDKVRKQKERDRMNKLRARLRDGVRIGLITEEDLGVEPVLGDVEEYVYDNEAQEEDDFGMPIIPVPPFPEIADYEQLLMSMPADHAKVVVVRHFGLRGKRAARTAGFRSEWTLYRREHELKKSLARQREHFMK